jgi:hypothetical protein
MINVSKGHNMTTSIHTPTHATLNTADVYESASAFTKSILKNDKDTIKMLDVLVAAGVPETHLISPIQGTNKHNSTSTPEWFNGLKAAIESQYPKEVHALMAMEKRAAGNTYIGANNRDGWMKKANSIIGGMRTAYINRLKREGLVAGGKMGADARTKPAEVKVTELLVEARGRMQKAETFTSTLDLDTMVRQLNAMIKSIG